MNTKIIGSNIRLYRTKAGFNQYEAAKRAGITRLAYANIETGRAEPRTGTLVALAKGLGVDVRDLLVPQRCFTSLRFRIGNIRTFREKSMRELEIIRIGQWLDNYNYLENELASKIRWKLTGKVPVQPGNVVAWAREKLALDTKEPVLDIGNMLENAGAKMYLFETAIKKCFGMSIGPQDGGPVIAVNVHNTIPIERRIFTVAHELGHLLMHAESYRADVLEENDREEKEADLFASFFLMPEAAFSQKWDEMSGVHWLTKVLHIKRFFKVSYRTVLTRLKEKGSVDDTIFKEFAVLYKRRYNHDLKDHYEPDALDEPERLCNADFMADRLNRLVYTAYEKEIISIGKAAEVLGIGLMEMRDLVQSWSI